MSAAPRGRAPLVAAALAMAAAGCARTGERRSPSFPPGATAMPPTVAAGPVVCDSRPGFAVADAARTFEGLYRSKVRDPAGLSPRLIATVCAAYEGSAEAAESAQRRLPALLKEGLVANGARSVLIPVLVGNDPCRQTGPVVILTSEDTRCGPPVTATMTLLLFDHEGQLLWHGWARTEPEDTMGSYEALEKALSSVPASLPRPDAARAGR